MGVDVYQLGWRHADDSLFRTSLQSDQSLRHTSSGLDIRDKNRSLSLIRAQRSIAKESELLVKKQALKRHQTEKGRQGER